MISTAAADAAVDRQLPTWRSLSSMAMLGFGSGLPYLLLGSTLTFWLSENNVPLALIGISAWFALPYSLKPFWATIIETIEPPFYLAKLGHRRGWLFLSQLMVMIGLSIISFINVQTQFYECAFICFVTAICAANQDMFVDAMRVDLGTSDRKAGTYLTFYQIGYRVGIFLAGSMVLIAAHHLGWPKSYLIAAGLMVVPLCATVMIHWSDSAVVPIPGRSRHARFIPRLPTGWRDRWSLPMILGISLFRFPDVVAEPMKNPFLHTFGGSAIDVGLAQGLVGLPAGIAGIFIGGMLVSFIGLRTSLLFATIVQCFQMCAFLLLFKIQASIFLISLIEGVDNFSSALTGTIMVSAMSLMIDKSRSVSDFAMLTSAYALLAKLLRGLSGIMISWAGYYIGKETSFTLFFTGLGICGIPGCILIRNNLFQFHNDGTCIAREI